MAASPISLNCSAKKAGEAMAALSDSIAKFAAAYQAGLISAQDAQDYFEINHPPVQPKLVMGVDHGSGPSYTAIHKRCKVEDSCEASPKPEVKKHVNRERRLALDKNI